jgi:soluble lytic murein transglycosylase-like protein
MIPAARKFVLLALVAACPALGADLAVLHNGFTIRNERHEILGSITRLYLTADGKGYADVPTAEIDHFEKDLSPAPAPASAAPARNALPAAAPARAPLPAATAARILPHPALAAGPQAKPLNLQEVVNAVSGRQNLDPDLVNSVISAESGFHARAVSPKGAQGLMQLMPGTASQLGVGNAFDPKANVDGGTRYLRMLLEQYNFDLAKALAAYNAGPQRVAQYHGVPPYYETRAYVARIIRDFNRKKLAEKKIAAAAAKAAPANHLSATVQKPATHSAGSPTQP